MTIADNSDQERMLDFYIRKTMIQEDAMVSRAYKNLHQGSPASKIVQVYRRIDELVDRSTVLIDCKPGCDICCHYHVYVTPLEVFAILEEIEKFSLVEKNKIVFGLKEYVEKTKNLGVKKHIETNIACVFLRDKKCSIYSIRPLACRRHHSADVSVCQRTFVDVTSEEPCPQDPNRVTVSTAIENLHRIKHIESNLDSNYYEFHSAMLEAMTNKSCLKRWKSGKSAFPSVTDKSHSGL